MERKTLREVLAALYQRAGISQTELARRMGTSPGQVNSLLSGERRWNEDWIEKFLLALGANSTILIEKNFVGLPEDHRALHRELQQILKTASPGEVEALSSLLDSVIKLKEGRV